MQLLLPEIVAIALCAVLLVALATKPGPPSVEPSQTIVSAGLDPTDRGAAPPGQTEPPPTRLAEPEPSPGSAR